MHIIGLVIASMFLIIISLVQRKMQFNFSDHYYHIGLIEAIKRNRHKFVSEHPNFLVEENFAYPQFYHWVLSFFGRSVYSKYFFLLNLSFSWLFLLLTFIFSGYLLNMQGMAKDQMLQGGIIIIVATTPFLHLPWNAKNLGLSTRTFGFITVTILNFSLLFYKINPTVLYAAWIILAIGIIILSSQMAHQYLVLGLIPISIVISPAVIVFYIIAAALCFLLSPGIMKKYYLGQFWHKYIFSKYLVKEHVLSGRQSIWLDFFNGFISKFRLNFKLGIIYLYSNPLLLIIWAIPVLVPAYFYGLQHNAGLSGLLARFNAIGLILFLLTSFRTTRFLGEPERYVEFFIPTIVLQLFYSLPESKRAEWFLLISVYSVVTIIILLVIEYRSVSKTTAKNQNEVDEMFSLFMPELIEEKTLISNSWHVMRRFYGTDVKTFTPNFTGLKTGDIPLTEIFKRSFIYLDAGALPLIKEKYGITYCIIEKNKPGFEEWESIVDAGSVRICISNRFSLYRL
jgi:hypothetical protein